MDLKEIKRRLFWTEGRKIRELEYEISGFVLEGYEYHNGASSISNNYRETLGKIYGKYSRLGLSDEEIFRISERKARIIHRDLVNGMDTSRSERKGSGERAILVYRFEDEIEN